MVYTLVAHLIAKDDAEAIKKVSAKLQEASQVYTKDKETLAWYDSVSLTFQYTFLQLDLLLLF